jgi:hypothetical protein
VPSSYLGVRFDSESEDDERWGDLALSADRNRPVLPSLDLVAASMNEEYDLWSAYHFTLASDSSDPQGLLRVVADHLDAIGPVEVADITFRATPHEDGIQSRPEMTVYYDRVDSEPTALADLEVLLQAGPLE